MSLAKMSGSPDHPKDQSPGQLFPEADVVESVSRRISCRTEFRTGVKSAAVIFRNGDRPWHRSPDDRLVRVRRPDTSPCTCPAVSNPHSNDAGPASGTTGFLRKAVLRFQESQERSAVPTAVRVAMELQAVASFRT